MVDEFIRNRQEYGRFYDDAFRSVRGLELLKTDWDGGAPSSGHRGAGERGPLPVRGGDATTLIVTVPLDALRRDLGTGELGPAEKLSAARVRRWLAPPRSSRPFSARSPRSTTWAAHRDCFRPAQRKARIIRARECRAQGCTIPAAWCEAHHWGRPWVQGGRTDLKDGLLLCSWHHHRAHDPTYQASQMPDGDVRLSRRT